MARALTPRGRATKQRIVEIAAAMIHERGVDNIRIEEVMDEAKTSKSQIYHYFSSREALVQAVIELQTRRILKANAAMIGRMDSLDTLRAWGRTIVGTYRIGGEANGCPLGSLAKEAPALPGDARHLLAHGFVS